MADDDVVRVLDEDRRAPFRAARMGDDDAAARRRLPRYGEIGIGDHRRARGEADRAAHPEYADAGSGGVDAGAKRPRPAVGQRVDRSEEHTSELQSLMRISYAVFCLKKQNTKQESRHKRTN